MAPDSPNVQRRYVVLRLEGRVCVITGGARGIGKAIGQRLGGEGAKVVIGDLNAEQAEEAASEARDMGIEAIAVGVDVTKRDQVRALVERNCLRIRQAGRVFSTMPASIASSISWT